MAGEHAYDPLVRSELSRLRHTDKERDTGAGGRLGKQALFAGKQPLG